MQVRRKTWRFFLPPSPLVLKKDVGFFPETGIHKKKDFLAFPSPLHPPALLKEKSDFLPETGLGKMKDRRMQVLIFPSSAILVSPSTPKASQALPKEKSDFPKSADPSFYFSSHSRLPNINPACGPPNLYALQTRKSQSIS